MRSAAVNEAWEFYRDNCQGFKEPMRKEFRRLDEYVASLESENAKLREENARLRSCLSDDAENARMIMGENAKLRELVRHALTFCVNGYCSEYEGCMWAIGKSGCSFADRAKKLGVVG